MKAKMKKDLIEIYQKSLVAPSPAAKKHHPTLNRPPSVSNWLAPIGSTFQGSDPQLSRKSV
jgi:hypothetical protein